VSEVLAGGPRTDLLQGGPWRVGTRPLKKPGRGGLTFIPFAQRGQTIIMVNTAEEAEELVAFLNYCGTEEFTTR
jgi:hypothetical protein